MAFRCSLFELVTMTADISEFVPASFPKGNVQRSVSFPKPPRSDQYSFPTIKLMQCPTIRLMHCS